MQELPCQHFGCHTQLGLWPWPRSSSRCRSSSGSAAGGCGGCPCAVVPAHCSFSAPSGGEGEGSLRWHTGQHRLLAYKGNTSPLFASSWEFKNCISPPENCWSRGQAGFPNLRTGVVQQLPLATQPMNQEDLSNAAVPRPPPVWLVPWITGTEQNWTHPPAPTQWPIPNFNPRVLVRWNPLELQNLSKRHGWAGAWAVSLKALRNGKLLTSSEPAVPSPCWAAWHLCLGHCPPPLGAPKPPLVAPSTAAGSCAGELWNRCSSAAVRLLPPHTSFLSLPSKIT